MHLNYNAQKMCPFCGENVPVGVGRCPYCGSILETSGDSRITPPEGNADSVDDSVPRNNDGDMPARQVRDEERPYDPHGGYATGPRYEKAPLNNGLKVFLTILFTILPGIGQVAGIITAIVFMSAADNDRKSFGVALLVACLVLFVFSCIGCFILAIAAQQFPYQY